MRRDGAKMELIWGKCEAEYSRRASWTAQIALNRLVKFVFARSGFGCGFGSKTVRPWAETLTDLSRIYGDSAGAIPDAAASRSFSVCHLQLKPGAFLGFCVRYFDADFLAQGIEIAKQTVVSITGKMPAQKL